MEKFSGKKADSYVYVFDGYIYHQDKRYQYIYRCSKRRNFKCQGRLQQEGETYTLMFEHDHPPEKTATETLKMKREMKEMCKNENMNNKDIFDRVSRNYPAAAVSLTYNTMRSPLHREKIKRRPSLPISFLSLQTQLETYEPLKNIYKGKATSANDEIALIFSTDGLLKELASSTEMFLDGTFSVLPRIPKVAQLYTIHIRCFQTAIATVFILFETRTKSLYDAVWIKIKDLVPDLEKNIQFIMLDYEHAAGASVSDHFPSASIHGCWFHYNQALFRKWKSLDLLNAPRDVLSMTMTLPLAPPEYFLEGYKIIEKQADSVIEYPDIHLFLAYLRRNWLPAASKVSVYKCPARTNNIVESFHNMASKKFGTKHPNLWIFLEKMINLIKDQELDLGRAKRGLRVRRICSRSQRQKNLRIMEIQEDLITGRISLQQFLKMFNNEHEHQQYGMQKLIYEDSNNNDDINLEHFVELQKKNAAVGETSSRRVNVLAHSRGRDRGRGRTRNSISLQRSSHISSEMNNPTMHNLVQLNTSPPNPEVYDQRSNSTSRENRVHISRENISHDIHDRAISQDISVLNLSDEDIYCIPPDDYGNIFPDETEKEDIPYYPVQPISNIRTSNCCSVCLVKRADHIFIPCGHLCCCMDCILQLQSKRCPICNVDYNSYLKVITP